MQRLNTLRIYMDVVVRMCNVWLALKARFGTALRRFDSTPTPEFVTLLGDYALAFKAI